MPKKYFDNNVTNTRKLLRVFVKNKIKFFIFSSSCTVYGNQKKTLNEKLKPFKEDEYTSVPITVRVKRIKNSNKASLWTYNIEIK